MRKLMCATVLLLPLLTGCADLNFYSDEQLEPLSLQAYEEASSQHPVITSGSQYQMVQDVAAKITRAADENFPWEARLLDAPDTPNAFCLPNGRIAIYTGILKIADDADMLAAIMGHEVAHATLRHGGKRMTQGTLSQAAMAVVDTGLGMAELGTENRGMVMGLLGAGAQYGVLLPYSRDSESEADEWGIRYAIRAGYDPMKAPVLWERMAKLGSGGPEWLSTHPDPLERAKKLREIIPRIVAEEKGWQPKQKKPTKKVNPGAVGR